MRKGRCIFLALSQTGEVPSFWLAIFFPGIFKKSIIFLLCNTTEAGCSLEVTPPCHTHCLLMTLKGHEPTKLVILIKSTTASSRVVALPSGSAFELSLQSLRNIDTDSLNTH